MTCERHSEDLFSFYHYKENHCYWRVYKKESYLSVKGKDFKIYLA